MEDREKQTFVELKNKMVNQSMQLKSVSRAELPMAEKERLMVFTGNG